MILFFYGADTYRLKQKIKELKEKYVSASLGDTNLATIDGKTATYPEIVRQILAMPFLAKSRLVIIENLSLQGKKEVQDQVGDFLPKVPENTFLVFLEEGNPDKRTSLFKKLAKLKTQEFKPLEPDELSRWVKEEVKSRGGQIGGSVADKLVSYIGADLWRLSNEIDKLLCFNGSITEETVENMIKPQLEASVFTLVDEIAAKNMSKALKELHYLLENGENELYCLSMVVYQYRNLLIVKDLVDRANGRVNQWELAKIAGIHPYVAQKTLAQTHNFSLQDLKQIYKMLLDYDLAFKTGKMEPKVGLDVLIAKLCK